MAHNLHDEYPSMGGSRGMDIVNGFCCDVYRALEAKGHIGSPQIIINGFRERNDIKSLLFQQVSRLMGSVAPRITRQSS